MLRIDNFGVAARVVSLAAAVLLTGCAATSKPVDMTPAEPAEPPTKTVMEEETLDARALFDFDSADLTSEGMANLDGLVQRAGGERAGEVTVTGHTDRIGPADYNMGLSQRRADSVASYMEQKGVPASVITTYARGETEPVVQCEEQPWDALVECLQPNRRVVVTYPVTVEKEVTTGDN